MKSTSVFEKHPALTLSLIVIIVIIFLDVIAAWIFLPFDYNSFRTAHPYYHHALTPMKDTKNKWGEKIFDLHTNSFGFKDASARVVTEDPEVKRILFLGDSYTEGVGMAWEESFPGIIHNMLPDIEILNAGVVSYSPKLYYLKTKFLIEEQQLKFDELFVFIDNSDPLNEISYKNFEPHTESYFQRLKTRAGKFLFSSSYIYHTVSTFVKKSRQNNITQSWNPMSGVSQLDEMATAEENFIAATPLWSFTPKLYEKWGKEGLSLAADNMTRLIDLCRKNQIDVTLVIYPWPSHISRGKINDVQVGFWKKYSGEHNVDFINLYPAFFGQLNSQETIRKYFIPGDVHWNENGHRYMAEMLIPYVHKIKGRN
ncbi:MAG: SGNH/GDSL hydrolase family protein [Bacteroidales bacterium]|nr:SGNH/GDSL hydrolase family protein [Bacteroidales bacterium]MCF8403946.1 SGNH/GDSL hydrolase family protein [Bacteroidales bacterium]